MPTNHFNEALAKKSGKKPSFNKEKSIRWSAFRAGAIWAYKFLKEGGR